MSFGWCNVPQDVDAMVNLIKRYFVVTSPSADGKTGSPQRKIRQTGAARRGRSKRGSILESHSSHDHVRRSNTLRVVNVPASWTRDDLVEWTSRHLTTLPSDVWLRPTDLAGDASHRDSQNGFLRFELAATAKVTLEMFRQAATEGKPFMLNEDRAVQAQPTGAVSTSTAHSHHPSSRSQSGASANAGGTDAISMKQKASAQQQQSTSDSNGEEEVIDLLSDSDSESSGADSVVQTLLDPSTDVKVVTNALRAKMKEELAAPFVPLKMRTFPTDSLDIECFWHRSLQCPVHVTRYTGRCPCKRVYSAEAENTGSQFKARNPRFKEPHGHPEKCNAKW